MILLLGGARSGKSATAVLLASHSALPVTFIATGEAGDDDMARRIAHHRAQRPAGWATIEAPRELRAAAESVGADRFLIVDCLTLWVSNLLGDGQTDDQIVEEGRQVAEVLAGRRAVVVSNEVGLGIVPMNELARRYRDILGAVNAAFALKASRSLLMVAGRALDTFPVDALLADE